MKKTMLGLLIVLTLLLCGCGGNSENAPADAAASPAETDELPTVLDTMEYTLYTNIFYNKAGGEYVGKTITKTGTFATLHDSFNDVTRYYVWGYNDVTKCCDWQWEFVPKDASSLPANGSLVKMTGTFAQDEAALDGYWFVDAELEVQKIYKGPDVEVDMGTMSSTLERVQLINMQYYPQDYDGASVRLYGRVAGMDSLEHPYYDGAWQQPIAAANKLPAIGTLVIATGTWTADAVLSDAKVSQTTAY